MSNGNENESNDSALTPMMGFINRDLLAEAMIDRLLEEHDRANDIERESDEALVELESELKASRSYAKSLGDQLGKMIKEREELMEERLKLKDEYYKLREVRDHETSSVRTGPGSRFTDQEMERLAESNLWAHAQRELELAGFYEEEAAYGDMLPEAILELVGVFALQGHSGMSASIVTSVLADLLQFNELSPITSDTKHWNEVGEGVWQSSRNPSLFSEDGGQSWYHVDRRELIFSEEEPDGVARESEEDRCGNPNCECREPKWSEE